MVADRQGVPFTEFMGWGRHVTHRQFMLLDAWEREQWNQPDRTDHYLMRLTHETRYANRKHPDRMDLDLYKLPFTTEPPAEPVEANGTEPDLTVETAAARSKSRWAGRGFGPALVSDLPPSGPPTN